MGIPALVCRTCKNKFHSACLYKWFQTSGKSKCVLCQEAFFQWWLKYFIFLSYILHFIKLNWELNYYVSIYLYIFESTSVLQNTLFPKYKNDILIIDGKACLINHSKKTFIRHPNNTFNLMLLFLRAVNTAKDQSCGSLPSGIVYNTEYRTSVFGVNANAVTNYYLIYCI